MDFSSLCKQDFVFLDGGMGTMLHLAPGELPEALNLTDPKRVAAVHQAYLDAGSQILYANTFGANRLKLHGSGIDPTESIAAAIRNAKQIANGKALVALDVGPTGQLLHPAGTLSFDDAYDCYRETMTSLSSKP